MPKTDTMSDAERSEAFVKKYLNADTGTPTKDAFLEEVEDFLLVTDTFPTRFGFEALNDSRFVARLRRPDGDVLASTMDRVRAYMAKERARLGVADA